jgi:recombination endonuclease VII
MLSNFCKKCGSEFTHENTGIFDNGKVRFRFCNACNRRRAAKARILDPETSRTRKNEWQTQNLYGWSIAERDAQLASQGNACAICGRTGLIWGKGFHNVWHTDHEHGKEGTHRGILCANCNTALGNLEPFIDRVIEYLAEWKQKLSNK